MEKLRVIISFKNTSKDLELYTWINSFEEKSVDIKRILREAMEKERNKDVRN